MIGLEFPCKVIYEGKPATAIRESQNGRMLLLEQGSCRMWVEYWHVELVKEEKA